MKAKSTPTIILGIALTITVGALAWAFTIVGSPSFNRKVAGDVQRVENLQSIERDVEGYFTRHRKLPQTLASIVESDNWATRNMKDPDTNRDYEYLITGDYRYELCAEFALTSAHAALEQRRSPYNGSSEQRWRHGAGRSCFEREIPEGSRVRNLSTDR